MRLLFRTSPIDRLDGPPMFKGAISYDTTLASAKQLMVQLNDLLWDPFRYIYEKKNYAIPKLYFSLGQLKYSFW